MVSASSDTAVEGSEMRGKVNEAVVIGFQSDPEYIKRPLATLNSEAVSQCKTGDHVAAVVAFCKLFERAKRKNLIHPEMHVCYSNRAAAYLALGMWDEALKDAERARMLAQDALKRTHTAVPLYIKTFAQKGEALIGMGQYRGASLVLEEGCKMDPLHGQMRLHLETATQGIFRDLLEGKGMERRLLGAPVPVERITYHAHSAPLHKIKTDNMLPSQLLTPFQADTDHHVKDTYNYVTVQADIRMPGRHLGYLEDAPRHDAFRRAIHAALQQMEAEDKDARVLNLGCGAGLHAMMALRAGARHVTAVDRWLYMALACKESLVANGCSEEQYKVIYKRPSDLSLKADVPVCCNVLICDIFDEGLLTSGIVPAMRHCLQSILTDDAIIIPASATVYVQAVEARTTEVCGVDMSAINRNRWTPAFAAGAPLAEGMYRPLTEPMEAWHFNMRSPPEESGRSSLDLSFTADGIFNAVLFWFTLQLTPDITISSAPIVSDGSSVAAPKGMQPALQYMAGELRVERGDVLPLLATHNTVRMRFDIEEAEYLNFSSSDATFPMQHFSMLADTARNEAYQRAIEKAVKRVKEEDGEVHALDLGCGAGLFAMMAAKAGATSVVACDMHEPLCVATRKVAAMNKLSDKVAVVQKDIALLERGKEVRYLGVNLAVGDIFDAGLLGNNWLYLLDMAKRNVLQASATVIPAAATLYCMGIEARTGKIAGFDFSAFNKYRWDKTYSACYLDDMPHKRLTHPVRVFEWFFDGVRKGHGRENILRLEMVESGHLNAIAFWFDLHLDDEISITSAPDCIGMGGEVLDELDGASCKDVGPQQNPVRVRGKSNLQNLGRPQEAAMHPACSYPAPDGRPGSFTPARAFEGAKAGYTFGTGAFGLGYYTDIAKRAEQTFGNSPIEAASSQPQHAASEQNSQPTGILGEDNVPASNNLLPRSLIDRKLDTAETASLDEASRNRSAGTHQQLCEGSAQAPELGGEASMLHGTTAINGSITRAELQSALGGDFGVGSSECLPVDTAAAERQPQAEDALPAPEAEEVKQRPRHYWGQALQYLEKSADVTKGQKIILLVKRDGGQMNFRLRAGVGDWVARAPWRIEWGGGSSVENPHYQRVHYCQLLVSDFLMRVKSRRFPTIEKDMKMVLAHCGSLFLDPALLMQVYHEMVVMERIHQNQIYSPGVFLEGLTRPPLRLH